MGFAVDEKLVAQWRRSMGHVLPCSKTAARAACRCGRTLTTDPAADHRDQSSSIEKKEAISKAENEYSFLLAKEVHWGDLHSPEPVVLAAILEPLP